MRIRDLRHSRGWSQERLAEAADLDRTYLGHLERGTRNPSITNVAKVAKALDCSLSELFRGI